MEIISLLFFSFIVTFAGTGLVRHLALKRKIMDIPGHRSSHKIPTPRGGGLAIVICFLFLSVIFYYYSLVNWAFLLSVVIGGGMVAGIGLIDDIKGISPWGRLFIHFCAAGSGLIFMKYYGGVTHFIFPFEMPLLDLFLSLFLWVWFINLYNFMDGIDGIAATEAVCVFFGAFIIIALKGNVLFLPLLAFAASCAGFILWNLPPAKIFMGDVGSGFLGYVMGMFLISGNSLDKLGPWVWFILLGVFFVDASFTLIRRIIERKRWYKAHRSHAYQRASRVLKSHGKVTLAVFLINCLWLYPLAFMASRWAQYGIIIMFISFIPLMFISIYLIKQEEKMDNGQDVY